MTQPVLADVGHQFGRGKREERARAFIRDGLEQSAAAQRSLAINRVTALGEMTGGIAHDLRNILAVIESGLRLAERNSERPDKVRAYIAGAREGVLPDGGAALLRRCCLGHLFLVVCYAKRPGAPAPGPRRDTPRGALPVGSLPVGCGRLRCGQTCSRLPGDLPGHATKLPYQR